MAAASPAGAVVTETLERAPYAVTGDTENAVRADINAKRPGSYDAIAKWQIRWRYDLRPSSTDCRLEDVQVTLRLTMVEPALSSSDPLLQRSFDAYITKLRVHEDGHADIARATASRIDQALTTVRAPTCDDLEPRANEIAHGLIGDGERAQVTYDVETGHGATQGALWPQRHGPPPVHSSQIQFSVPQQQQPFSD